MNKPFPIIICDDSSLARKQMARTLQDWNVDITFARHGAEALEAIHQGKGDLLFLDLNMPIMDGYQLLERIQQEDLPTITIVVSADIQPDAYTRIKNLGALDFIKKPANTELISDVLYQYGLMNEMNPTEIPSSLPSDTTIDLKSYYQELCNVAMGHAADRLARLLKVYIQLPIPRIALITTDELDMIIVNHTDKSNGAIISQGFVSPGIAGEVLLMFNESSTQNIAKLLQYDASINSAVDTLNTHSLDTTAFINSAAEKEVLIDLANVLSGAFLNSLAHQLDITFNQNPPLLLNLKSSLLKKSAASQHMKKTLSIEITYRIAEPKITCDLLLLFTEDSLDVLNERVRFFE